MRSREASESRVEATLDNCCLKASVEMHFKGVHFQGQLTYWLPPPVDRERSWIP